MDTTAHMQSQHLQAPFENPSLKCCTLRTSCRSNDFFPEVWFISTLHRSIKQKCYWPQTHCYWEVHYRYVPSHDLSCDSWDCTGYWKSSHNHCWDRRRVSPLEAAQNTFNRLKNILSDSSKAPGRAVFNTNKMFNAPSHVQYSWESCRWVLPFHHENWHTTQDLIVMHHCWYICENTFIEFKTCQA